MRYFILLLCFLLPFCLAYLIKKTSFDWYYVLIITIMFGLLAASYLIKNNEKNQYSLKNFLFKNKISK
jgi:hypothetical protein